MTYLSDMKPIYKFNNGNGAMLCNVCRGIISTGKKTSAMLCTKHLREFVYNYPTKHTEGFTDKEMSELIIKLLVVKEKFFTNLGVHTGMMIGKDSITYHNDVFTAARMCYENRDSMHWYEFD